MSRPGSPVPSHLQHSFTYTVNNEGEERFAIPHPRDHLRHVALSFDDIGEIGNLALDAVNDLPDLENVRRELESELEQEGLDTSAGPAVPTVGYEDVELLDTYSRKTPSGVERVLHDPTMRNALFGGAGLVFFRRGACLSERWNLGFARASASAGRRSCEGRGFTRTDHGIGEERVRDVG